MFENNVSQDMSQDIQKQNTLNKITFKKQRLGIQNCDKKSLKIKKISIRNTSKGVHY